MLFGIGLFAAAFSSALSCALGASITCQSLLAHTASTTPASTSQTSDVRSQGDHEAETHNPVLSHKEAESNEEASMFHKTGPSNCPSVIDKPHETRQTTEESHSTNKNHSEFGRWADDGLYFRFIIVAIALVGISVGSSGADTINVIITAQVNHLCVSSLHVPRAHVLPV